MRVSAGIQSLFLLMITGSPAGTSVGQDYVTEEEAYQPTEEEQHALADEDWIDLLPDDEGKVLVATYCAMCHSLKYAVLGARNRDQWLGTIEKMVLQYHAPIDTEEIELIADYLSKYSGLNNPIAGLPFNVNSVSPAALNRLTFLTDHDVEAILQFRLAREPIEDLGALRSVIGEDKVSRLRAYLVVR